MADLARHPPSIRTMPWRLSQRILGVNLIILLVLALALLFLDSFRNQLRDERETQTRHLAELAATAVPKMSAEDVPRLFADVGRATGARVRLYDGDGQLRHDSWGGSWPTYRLRDPSTQRWTKEAARALDRAFNFVVGETSVPDFAEPEIDRLQAWPEALQALRSGRTAAAVRTAPDLTPVLSAATRTVDGEVVLVTANDRNFTRTVRQERTKLAAGLLAAALSSLLLSFFLARTIARPLHRDEIGLLARAVSDMSQSLRSGSTISRPSPPTSPTSSRTRSLRCARSGRLERVEDPALRRQLLDVARRTWSPRPADRRHQRGGATDAELARARSSRSTSAADRADLVSGWESAARRATRGSPSPGRAAGQRRRGSASPAACPGDRQSHRQCDQLLALPAGWSRSPPRGSATSPHPHRRRGPRRSARPREAIFNRFHSVRPEGEGFRPPLGAWPCDRACDRRRAMTGRLTCRTATTRLPAPASPSASGGGQRMTRSRGMPRLSSKRSTPAPSRLMAGRC
jgi:two-component system sensor histidine kinase ChvG